MTLMIICLATVVGLTVPTVVFLSKLTKAKVRSVDMLVYVLFAVYGIWTITVVVAYAAIVYFCWKADVTPMPGTDATKVLDLLRSQTGYSAIIALLAVVDWRTGIPYKSLRRIDLENNIGIEALEKARAAWQPAMLFCSILHVAGAYGSMALIHFLRATVT